MTTTPIRAAGSDINLTAWCADTAASHRYYEEEELAPYPGGDRDRGLVEWVVMALGNPEQPGARQVLAVLAARHGLELAPTGTAAELDRERRAHVCTERCAPNAHVAFQGRRRVTELEAELAEAHAQCRRLNRELDDVRAELAAAKTPDAHCDRGYPVGGAHPRIDWCGLRRGHTGPHHGGERTFSEGGTVQRATAVAR